MNQSQVLAIILTATGSKGGVLLFRYPCDSAAQCDDEAKSNELSSNNQFTVKNSEGFFEVTNQFHKPFGVDKDGMITFSDKVLSNFLTVPSNMSEKPFDVKVDDVQFVGYPVTVTHSRLRKKGVKTDGSGASTTTVNVVFALPETVHDQSKACFHQLSQQVAMAIKHEERRICFFCSQRQLMVEVIDDDTNVQQESQVSAVHPSMTMIQKKIPLAITLKKVFDSVAERGVVLELMNNWTEINFCLPIRAHNLPFESQLRIMETDIENCLKLLRPYHAALLLSDSRELINQLPIDSSPALIRVLKVASPKKSLLDLATDSDLELTQVFKLVKHLVYWAKATIIYPLCEKNVYVLSPNAPTSTKSELKKRFEQDFTGELNSNNLTEILAEFSQPMELGEHNTIVDDKAKRSEKVRMVVWMLQRRLLVQIHTYIYLRPQYLLEHPSSKLRNKPGGILNQAGKERLQSMSETNQTEFTRLCNYFDGTHHLEDIMYSENMSRTALLNIIDSYLPMIYKIQAPDPATSYYAKVT